MLDKRVEARCILGNLISRRDRVGSTVVIELFRFFVDSDSQLGELPKILNRVCVFLHYASYDVVNEPFESDIFCCTRLTSFQIELIDALTDVSGQTRYNVNIGVCLCTLQNYLR